VATVDSTHPRAVAFTSALRLVAASLKICYEMCQASTSQGFVHCRSSVTQWWVSACMWC